MKKLIFFLYPLVLIAFSIFSYLFVDPNLQYFNPINTGFAFDKRLVTTAIYILFIFLFFTFYFLFLSLVKKHKIDLKNIKFLIGITIVVLFLSYPAILSYDIFNYLTTAKVLFFYQENPYIVMPIEFLGDPSLDFTRAANKIALYGPVWIFISGIPYTIGLGNFLITLFSFKLFIVLFYIGTTLLVFKISKSIFSTALFALNPLIILETLVSSHNDIVMMFFALLSFLFFLKKNLWISILFLLLSILIKYATLFLLPIFIYMFWKQYVVKQEIKKEQIFYFSTLSMMLIFFLSPLREEIYPWYAIWFLVFVMLNPLKKRFLYTNLVFSLSLLLGYTPYMLTGTYLNPTPFLKTLVSFTPPVLFSIYYVIKKKI